MAPDFFSKEWVFEGCVAKKLMMMVMMMVMKMKTSFIDTFSSNTFNQHVQPRIWVPILPRKRFVWLKTGLPGVGLADPNSWVFQPTTF